MHLKRRNWGQDWACISFLRLEMMLRNLTHSFSQPARSTRPLSWAHRAAAERQQGEVRLEKCACRGPGEGAAQGANHFHSAAPSGCHGPPYCCPGSGNRTVSREGKKETCAFLDRSCFLPGPQLQSAAASQGESLTKSGLHVCERTTEAES